MQLLFQISRDYGTATVMIPTIILWSINSLRVWCVQKGRVIDNATAIHWIRRLAFRSLLRYPAVTFSQLDIFRRKRRNEIFNCAIISWNALGVITYHGRHFPVPNNFLPQHHSQCNAGPKEHSGFSLIPVLLKKALHWSALWQSYPAFLLPTDWLPEHVVYDGQCRCNPCLFMRQ